MEISVVVDRSSSAPPNPARGEGGRAVRLKVVDGSGGGTLRLAGLLRKLAAVLERSGSGAAELPDEEEPALSVSVQLAPDASADGDGPAHPVPLSLRPPPPFAGSPPQRADLEFVSHELRTPINAVLGYTSLLRERVYGELSAEQAEAVERIRSAARNLLGALDHLRDVAKLDLGRFEGNPADPGDEERRGRTRHNGELRV